MISGWRSVVGCSKKKDWSIIPLAVGPNTITTVVTAQDGTTTETYTVTVTKAAPPAGDSFYVPQISVTRPSDSLQMVSDGIFVHPGVSPNGDGINDVFTIDNIANYPENKVTIIDRNGALVYSAKGYDNRNKAFDGHANLNGKMLQPGTYFYELEYTVGGVSKRKTGFVVLKY